jgi:PEGA domain-containing protein
VQPPTGSSWSSAGRPSDLQQLKQMYGDITRVSDINQLRPIFHRLEAISQQYASDTEMQSIIGEVRQRLIARGQSLMDAGQGPITGQTPAAPTPVGDLFGRSSGAPVSMPTQAMPSAPPSPPPPRTDGGTPSHPPSRPPAPATTPSAAPIDLKKILIVGSSIGLVAFIAVVIGIRVTRKTEPPKPVIVNVPFEVRTTPPGASIRVNNEHKCTSDCKLELPPGEHQIQAVLDGYEAMAKSVSIAAGATVPPVELALQPVPQSVKITTDLDAGKVTLDDQPAVDLVDGAVVFDRVPAGKHTIKVSGRGTEAAFPFEVVPGKAPLMETNPTARGLIAVLVSNFQTDGKLRASVPTIKVSLDSQAIGQAGADGLDLKGLSAGFRELTLGEGEDAQKKLISIGPAPMLTALILRPTVTAGTLTVVTGEDGVSVFINGKESRRKSQRGALRLPDMPAGPVKVRVQKDGYQPEPEQIAEIKKGVETKLEFKLKPVPRMAALSIRGAAAGAQVLIDGQSIGAIGPDGSFSASNIQPGEHTVEIRKEGTGRRTQQRMFQAGSTIEIGGAEVALERPPARLRVSVNAPDARVTWRRADEPPGQARVATSSEFNVQEGSYVVSATAPNYSTASVNVQIAAGETKAVDLRLTRQSTPSVPSAKTTYGMADWERPGEWSTEGGWTVRRGGNYVLFRPTPTYGTFAFNIILMRGGRLQWVVNHIDERNHVLFQLDDSGKFLRREVINGRSNNEVSSSHGIRKKDFVVQIDITPNSITHSLLYEGSSWKAIDTWTGSVGPNAKFGLFIPSRDQYGLANFKFTPK